MYVVCTESPASLMKSSADQHTRRDELDFHTLLPWSHILEICSKIKNSHMSAVSSSTSFPLSVGLKEELVKSVFVKMRLMIWSRLIRVLED